MAKKKAGTLHFNDGGPRKLPQKQLRRKEGWYEPGTSTPRCGLPRKTIEAFYRDIDKLRAKYFVKDEDGDYPIRVEVLDRTKYVSASFLPLPHLHKLPLSELSTALRYAASNVEQAGQDMRRIVYAVEDALRKGTRTDG